MQTNLAQPDFDVIIVGSGIAGALAAYRLARAKVNVLMLEAGGVPSDSLGRYALVRSFISSPSKATDSPFCGDNILASQPTPRAPILGTDYYDYPAGFTGDKFVSFYERLVGGSTWHWQGIYVRMVPNDFAMNTLYGKGVDWPLDYGEIEPWYVEAEKEMGVAGDREERADDRRHRRYRVRYPMPALSPSYLDREVAKAVEKIPLIDGIRLRVNTVPHAINSRNYDGRPSCEGYTSCVPLCPIKARYEAIFHVEKAMAAGAVLRTQAVVTKLQLDESGKRVTGVYYRRWQSSGQDGKRVPLDESDRYVSARIVVLAANAVENPMVLLRSNAANSSKSVGCYLMDHPIKQSYGLAVEPLYPFRGPQTTSQIENFRDTKFRRDFAGFKTSIKNDGWLTNITGAPRGTRVAAQKEAEDWHPGTLLDLVQNRGYFGEQLRNALARHGVRQITLNSACEQLPVKENSISLSTNLDDLNLQRPLIQYRVDSADNYVRNCFKKIVEVHRAVFDAMGITTRRKLQLDDDDKPLTFGGSGHIMGTTRMGNKTDAVVDTHCRAYDHQNLFILGSSVFPTGSTANPISTIAALALRAAETIKKQLLSSPAT
jgi:choline dehydrogenase-like flavoprotein